MTKKLNISSMLDFSKIDLTEPKIVIEEMLAQLPSNSQGIIQGCVDEYKGKVTSYTIPKPSIASAIESITAEERVDIQKNLGKQGEVCKKFECYLFTSSYKKYRYRMFFMQYGIANYPVQFTLEESIAKSIKYTSYIVECNNREEVEALIIQILTCKKMLGIMQELIRIHQATRSAKLTSSNADSE